MNVRVDEDSVSALTLDPARRMMSLARLGGGVIGGWFEEPRTSPASQAAGLQEVCRLLCEIHGWNTRLFGRLPRGPVVLVSNHMSYIDPLVHCCALPCLPIAKSDVRGWPLIGSVATRLGVNFVRRGDTWSGASTLRRALRTLRAGTSVLNFPEGTTTEGTVLPFRRGAFGLARLAEVPVVPLALAFEHPSLAWTSDALLLPHYLQALRSGPCEIRVIVGEAMWPRDYVSAGDMATSARRWIETALATRPV